MDELGGGEEPAADHRRAGADRARRARRLLVNRTLGAKLKVVLGYLGGEGIEAAMERGEVHARAGQSWAGWGSSNPNWVAEKKVIPILQMGIRPAPDLPGVPALIDLVQGNKTGGRALCRRDDHGPTDGGGPARAGRADRPAACRLQADHGRTRISWPRRRRSICRSAR